MNHKQAFDAVEEVISITDPSIYWLNEHGEIYVELIDENGDDLLLNAEEWIEQSGWFTVENWSEQRRSVLRLKLVERMRETHEHYLREQLERLKILKGEEE